MGIDIFHIQLPDSLIELKKIIFSILNNTQRKPEDNIVLRQYLISYPEFIDHLKLKEEITDSKDLLLKISEHLKKEEIEKDKVIFYNGQFGKTFYLILEGEVSVLISYEFKIKITDKQLFEYMNFLMEHKEYELIRLILESNHLVLNDNDYGDNILYLKYKSVIDKALPLHLETEKITSLDYIKRYNFFNEIDNNNIFELGKKNKEAYKKEEKKHNRISKSPKKDKKSTKYLKKELESEGGDSSRRKNKNFFNNIETIYVVWKYFELCRLSKGKCFGELALQKEGKRRNATIITTQDSVFGTLQKDVYQLFIKETMDKARKTNVELLLKSKLFKGCNSEKFESHYFNYFKFIKKYNGEYLFKQ